MSFFFMHWNKSWVGFSWVCFLANLGPMKFQHLIPLLCTLFWVRWSESVAPCYPEFIMFCSPKRTARLIFVALCTFAGLLTHGVRFLVSCLTKNSGPAPTLTLQEYHQWWISSFPYIVSFKTLNLSSWSHLIIVSSWQQKILWRSWITTTGNPSKDPPTNHNACTHTQKYRLYLPIRIFRQTYTFGHVASQYLLHPFGFICPNHIFD